ncbi:MAG: methylenetetrahydrofolate--tRNA-(uracil(54)-C(5))-methyltransferase (FADH(2)-oxidizing) TrmFO [Bacillota bacterium]|nr:methylenetetrahydrofolate--tRNA-(uracil(54)-C(5))-methyltransferase (FADH(2)-oxidizing) TrmFO [Bacillota bacterium]
MEKVVNVIGAGLAGCEAAWQIAKRGIRVRLYEMKPVKYTPAHHYGTFAELVCSNSLRSDRLENAVGLLKAEMRELDSLIMRCADKTRIPAGGALAVDRTGFSELVTQEIKNHENITVVNEEVTEIDNNGITIIASGPLTSDVLSEYIAGMAGCGYLHFFDAAAPIVALDSIDMSKAYRLSRYNKGEDDYINCPMNKEEYDNFWNELVKAELAEVKELDKEVVFEGCMPVETMAKRGVDTLRFGPLKPVGLPDPSTGREPYAVVQLRQDNSAGTLYNIVGFQTRLKWPEQKRVFSMIPGLENADFMRYGVMHKNTFLNSPKLLGPTYKLRNKSKIYFAGQITGVEGYVESAASGIVAGINAAMEILEKEPVVFPRTTVIGAMAGYISDESVRNFQPMNANFGLVDTSGIKERDKKKKYSMVASRSLDIMSSYKL